MTARQRKHGKARGGKRSARSSGKDGTPPAAARFSLSEPPPLDPPLLRRAWPHMLVVLVLLVAVYALTAPRTVTLEDDGEFVMTAFYLGVAHPPGYPLFVLLAHPFTWLPIGSIAYRVHLASGFFGAAACGVLWWIVRSLIPRKTVAYAVALAFGVSRVFWSQAVIAEVYTLNVLLFSLMLAVCLAYLRWRRFEALAALGLLLGLALSDHWPLTVLALPCLLLTLWPARRSILEHVPRALLYGVPLFLLGLSPYLWMVLRSQAAPQISFAGSIQSWDAFRYYVSRGQYADSSPSAGWWDRLQFVAFWGRQMVQQFTPLGAAFVAAGFVFQWREWKRTLSLGLLIGFLCTLAALILLRNVDYQFDARAITKVFPIIPWLIMALWLGLGLQRVLTRLASTSRWLDRAVPLGLGGLIVLTTFVINLSDNDRRDYDFARDYGMTFLSSFEPHAIVFTQGDFETFVMQYLHFVEGVRPDIRILQVRGLSMARDGRLFHETADPRALLTDEQRQERILAFIKGRQEPVYFLRNAPRLLSDVDYGFYKKIDRSSGDQITTTLTIDDGLLGLFRRLLTEPPGTDDFTVYTRAYLIGKMVPVLSGLVDLDADPSYAERYGKDLDAATENLWGLLARVSFLESRNGAPPEKLLAWLKTGEKLADQAISKAQRAEIYLLEGKVLRKLGRPADALTAFDRSIAIYPHPANQAIAERRSLLSSPNAGQTPGIIAPGMDRPDLGRGGEEKR